MSYSWWCFLFQNGPFPGPMHPGPGAAGSGPMGPHTPVVIGPMPGGAAVSPPPPCLSGGPLTGVLLDAGNPAVYVVDPPPNEDYCTPSVID